MPEARPDATELVQTELEALLILLGVPTFLVGFVLTLVLGSEQDGSWMPPLGWLIAAAGAGALSMATARVTRRLRPGISRYENWKFQSWLGCQWTRPSVLIRSWRVVRRDA